MLPLVLRIEGSAAIVGQTDPITLLSERSLKTEGERFQIFPLLETPTLLIKKSIFPKRSRQAEIKPLAVSSSETSPVKESIRSTA
jgi:hypothetical protein